MGNTLKLPVQKGKVIMLEMDCVTLAFKVHYQGGVINGCSYQRAQEHLREQEFVCQKRIKTINWLVKVAP